MRNASRSSLSLVDTSAKRFQPGIPLPQGSSGLQEAAAEDTLIAHWRKDDQCGQLLEEHLQETSRLARIFASKIDLPEIGTIAGLVHDFGKAAGRFQRYLRSKEGLISPDEDGYSEARRGEIDHSTAGAQLIHNKLADRGLKGMLLSQFLALVIASHHSGLIDCLKPDGTNGFQRRIEKVDKDTHLAEARKKLADIEKQLDKILDQPIEMQFFEKIFEGMSEPDSDSQSTLPFKHGLLARFLLSCLLDADRLNTADFENPGNESIRNYGKYIPWEILIQRLEAKFAEFAQATAQMQRGRGWEVNQLRAQVAQACLDLAAKQKGIYQLTVPTGGGKTLAGLRFALHHAYKHEMERIFYVVPYITIIDQNAKDVRAILEKQDERGMIVLEHHSNFVPPEDTRSRHNLLAEDWDAPIVFTTQVQFLEALFGSGTRDARRMHQLANSVIILDEVQTVPIRITHMFTTALRFLVNDCGATAVLCTATQPPFDELENTYRELKIAPEQHIILDEPELFKRLKRTEVHDERKPGGLTNAEIGDLAESALEEKGSVLIVVNTRASAQALYREIKYRNLGAATYHLSTNMCPAHRVDKLEEIKAKLKASEPVICVSTQLIEAGVDIDFGAVIRALAGLDSIAQSAGRCNRHGIRHGLGSVWVVNPQEENLDRLHDIKIGSEHAQRVLDDFKDNPDAFGDDRIGLKAIDAYYSLYYRASENELNYPVSPKSSVGRNDNLFSLLSQNGLSTDAYVAAYHSAPEILLRQSFRTANGEFRVIDSLTRGVVVPYRDGTQIITDLCGAFGLEMQANLLKQAQRYSVNLFEHQFKKLLEVGAIREVQEGAEIYYLKEEHYSDEFGWSDKPVSDMPVLIG
jgi:CRISPR-associated endonuclease/helicase Cas3